MKRDPKVMIIALPFMAAMFMLWSQLNKKANDDFQRKISMEEPAPPQANIPSISIQPRDLYISMTARAGSSIISAIPHRICP